MNQAEGILDARPFKFSLIVLFLVSFLMILPFCKTVSTVESSVVGVKPGDWARYKVTRLGESNEAWLYPSAVWIKVEVLNVSGTKVAIREIICYESGNEAFHDWVGNFSENPYMGSVLLLIGTNLGPNDVLIRSISYYTEPSLAAKITADLWLNDTTQRNFGGLTREVNQLRYSAFSYMNIYGGDLYAWRNFTCRSCWDKATGILIESEFQQFSLEFEDYYKNHQASTFRVTIESTNLWNIPEKDQPLLALLWIAPVFAVGSLVIFQLNRIRKKRC